MQTMPTSSPCGVTVCAWIIRRIKKIINLKKRIWRQAPNSSV
jgi:hypothetical protein